MKLQNINFFSASNNDASPCSLFKLCGNDLSLVEVEFTVSEIASDAFEYHCVSMPKSFEQMVAKRRCEYLAGRIAAKLLIDQLGFSGQVLQGDLGCPIWPEGLIGSISHIEGRAIACVCLNHHMSALGIDMERVLDNSSANELSPLFLNSNELNKCEVNNDALLPFNQLVTLIFSAKEAIYKALFPSVGCFFGFDAVSLIKLQHRVATFEFQQTLSDHWVKGVQLDVEYVFSESRVYSLVVVPA